MFLFLRATPRICENREVQNMENLRDERISFLPLFVCFRVYSIFQLALSLCPSIYLNLSTVSCASRDYGNTNTNPSAHKQSALYIIRVPRMAASHLKIVIPVETAMITVAGESMLNRAILASCLHGFSLTNTPA